ncbi:MAG: LysM peptidoglycan-binding domain-containing protein [Verrucomicrobiota bacterium]|jgi:LysM repeat protein
MRPIITVTAVVLLHLCVVAVLVGVNGCRSTSGFEPEPDLATFSAGARPAGGASTLPVVDTSTRIPTPAPTKVAPIVKTGAGGKYTCVKGDTLVTVAAREKVSPQSLAKANGISANATLKAGQILTIPAASTAPAKKAGTKSTGSASAAAKSTSTNAAPAAPAPTFAPLKIISLTNPAGDAKPADAAPATK